jgi:ribulose 1,5-bisphosphate synthetase/thiazole synthase
MTGATFKSGQATLPTPNSTSSFWHTETSKILLGHRTSDHLPAKADIVIIGSGISGAFAAHYLAEADHEKDVDVVMLEAREACWGATGRVSSSRFLVGIQVSSVLCFA